MNSEFRWRNEMRKLDRPAAPSRDLWPAIATRIASASIEHRVLHRRHRVGWAALAAALLVAIGAGLGAYHRWPAAPPSDAIASAQAPVVGPPRVVQDPLPRTALDWAVPEDPVLAKTAENLDTASAQLQSALEQRPDAVFLVGLLNRTNSMRLRLLRNSPDAG